MFRSPLMTFLFFSLPLAGLAESETYTLLKNSFEADAPSIDSERLETAAAWSALGPVARLRIFAVKLKDGRLVPEQLSFSTRVFDDSERGDNILPSVAVNPVNGRFAVLWVNRDGPISRVMFRAAGEDSIELRETEALVESPQLETGQDGYSYAIWNEVSGDQSRVYAASDLLGPWKDRDMSRRERPYSVSPQILMNADGSPDVYYFGLEGANFQTEFFRFYGSSSLPIGSALEIPADRFPYLYRTSENNLGALWLEPEPEGGRYYDLLVSPRGELQLQPFGQPNTTISEIAIAPEHGPARVWFEGDGGGGERQMAILLEDGEELRLPMEQVASDPAISVSDNWHHIIWVQEDISTGMSSVRYRRVGR